jgi:hypothetical protein
MGIACVVGPGRKTDRALGTALTDRGTGRGGSAYVLGELVNGAM